MSPSADRKPVPLFFAFPDGVFHHVCAECNALCCRGGGFGGSLKREMPFLLKRYPALSVMATCREGDILHFANPMGRCFFLNDSNLCRIEIDHGKTKKPGVCAVFPFNGFQRIGRTVAVIPHFGCPLRVQLPARPGKVEGTHATVEQGIRNSGLLEADYVESQMRDTRLHPAENSASVLKREKRFRGVCADALGGSPFRDTVLAESRVPKSLEKRVSQAASLMRWESSGIRGAHEIDDLLLAMASAFRMEALHMSSEDILAALLLGERAARQACSISNEPPTPQALFRILQSLGPSIRLLAYSEGFPPILQGTSNRPFGSSSELSFVYHVALERISRDGTLRALEETFRNRLSATDRKVIVHQLGLQLENPA